MGSMWLGPAVYHAVVASSMFHVWACGGSADHAPTSHLPLPVSRLPPELACPHISVSTARAHLSSCSMNSATRTSSLGQSRTLSPAPDLSPSRTDAEGLTPTRPTPIPTPTPNWGPICCPICCPRYVVYEAAARQLVRPVVADADVMFSLQVEPIGAPSPSYGADHYLAWPAKGLSGGTHHSK